MSPLDKKINEEFPGLVVRKDLVKEVKGNAIVPSYVLEYLLAQYCSTDNEDIIQEGINAVKEILRKHYVHRNQANMIRSDISRLGKLKIIDKVGVDFIPTRGIHEANFSNLGIGHVFIDDDTVRRHKKLLVGDVWAISEIEYLATEDKSVSPWILNSLKPIQLSDLDLDQYIENRKKFTTDEWIDLILQSIGFNPEMFSFRNKLIQLTRLIPFCERNYNLIELGPKGTGKSHVFSELSPHGMLISGGEITSAKLFVSNTGGGKLGLVGYMDVVAMDEFAGKNKRVDKGLVDIMKNYMANKSFSRGIESMGAEASMVFIGNTKHTVPYMLKNSDLFDEVPANYHDSAILDRFHYYIPGWEVDVIRREMFTSGYGFVVDYLAEALKSLRNFDYSNAYKPHLTLSTELSTRDYEGIHKTFSGLMKIIHPDGNAEIEEMETLLKYSIEGRKRVKDQIMRIDDTFPEVKFYYKDRNEKTIPVKTIEEESYPNLYYLDSNQDADSSETENLIKNENPTNENDSKPEEKLKEGHRIISENQKGITFKKLFAPYLKNAHKITLTDPYIRAFFQVRNLLEFIDVIIESKDEGDEVEFHLVTIQDELNPTLQLENFEKIKSQTETIGILFTWEFDFTNSIHARHIIIDTGWKISLDRGLDIYQKYEMNDVIALQNRNQKYRSCKGFEITYIKV